MKRFFLTLLFCSITVPCLAWLPLTEENLKAAMDYGISSRQDGLALERFLEPWLIGEKLLKNPYRRQENVLVYSPYLLAAIHARDKIEGMEMPQPEEVRNAVQEYAGILLIGIVINTPQQVKQEDLTIHLAQKKIVLEPYAVTLLNAEEISGAGKREKDRLDKAPAVTNMKTKGADGKNYRVRLQCYFDETGFNPGEKYSVTVSDVLCGIRRFDVNPASLR